MLKAMKAAYPDRYPFSDRWSKPTARRQPAQHPRPRPTAPAAAGATSTPPGTPSAEQVRLHRRHRRSTSRCCSTSTSWSKEELLDPESFTQPDDAARQKFATGKSFVISANAQTLVNEYRPDLAKTIPGATIVQDPAADRAGRATVKPASRLENGIMISKKARDSKNFVAMMQFIDWLWYSDAGQEFAKWGVEGTTYTKDAAGKLKLAPDVNVRRAQPRRHQAPAEGLRLLQRRVRLRRQHRARCSRIFSAEEQEFQKVMNARKTLPRRPAAPAHRRGARAGDAVGDPAEGLRHPADACKFILGQRPLTEWDAYVTELKGKNMHAVHRPGQQGVRPVQEGTTADQLRPAVHALGRPDRLRSDMRSRSRAAVGPADRRLARLRRHRPVRARAAPRLPGLARPDPAGDRLPAHPRARAAQRRRRHLPALRVPGRAPRPARVHLRGPGDRRLPRARHRARSWSWASCPPSWPPATRPCSGGAATSPRPAPGPSGPTLVRATVAHLVDRYGLDAGARLADRGVERAQPQRVLGRTPTRTPTTGCTR